MAITVVPPTLPDGITVQQLNRMTGTEILTAYGPQVYALMGSLQGSGSLANDVRTDYDLAVTNQMRREIILKEGDCRCGKIDCWKRELGID